MSGSIIDRVRRDAKRIVSKGGFQDEIVLKAINGFEILLTGLATEHHVSFDTDGQAVNALNSHICISEDDLIDSEYPYKNMSGDIFMLNHVVKKTDNGNILKSYLISQVFPNKSTGVIVCLLTEYNE